MVMKEAIQLSSKLIEAAWTGSMIIKNLEYMREKGVEVSQPRQWEIHNRLLEACGLHSALIELNDELIKDYDNKDHQH